MIEKGKAYTIDMARKHLAIRVIVIAILAVYLFVRDFFRTLLHSRRSVIAAYAAFFSLAIMQLFPHVISAGMADSGVEISIEQVDSSAELTYGCEGYIDYSIKNTGNVDLTNVRCEFDKRYVKKIELASDSSNASRIDLGCNQSVAIRAYFKSGIDAKNKYNMEVSYKVDTADNNNVELTNHINFKVEKKELVIIAPNTFIDVGEAVPVISREALMADGLADGDVFTSVVSGIRDISYEVDDATIAGQYQSEDLSAELSSVNYSICFVRGELTIVETSVGGPEAEIPEIVEAETKTPETEEPETEISEIEEPETEIPEIEEPETEIPEIEEPETEIPETEEPETEISEIEEPEAEISETEESETEIIETEEPRPTILPDITAPIVKVSSNDMTSVGNIFVSNAGGILLFECEDIVATENELVSGVDCLNYAFEADEPASVDVVDNIVNIAVPSDFEGYIFYSVCDKAGNVSETEYINIVRNTNTEEEVDSETEEPEQIVDNSDKLAPVVIVNSNDMELIGDTFVAKTAGTINFEVIDQGLDDDRIVSGAASLSYMLNGESGCIETVNGCASITLPKDFEGNIYYRGKDVAGNTSERYCVKVDLIVPEDITAPEITVSSNDMEALGNTFIATEVAGTLRFEAKDVDPGNGEIVSGVKNIICSYGDIEQLIEPTDDCVEVVLPEDYDGKVFYQAVDNSGNKSEVKCVFVTIEKFESNEVIRIKVPSTMKLYVAPYSGGDQIYSSDYVIENQSDFDVDVKITNVRQEVKRDNIGVDILKIVNIIFNVFNNKEEYKIMLSDGENGNVYSGTIKANSDENNTLRFNFTGSVNLESAEYWRDSDLIMTVTYDLRKSSEKGQD